MGITIPESMKVVQLHQDGVLSVEEIQVPTPGPGEVLVRIAAAPINPSDVAFVQGAYSVQTQSSMSPGFEGSGIVVAAGEGILPRLWLGKRVACAVGSGGTWGEYLVTRAELCVPLPRNLTLEQGSMMIVNPLTALALLDIVRSQKHSAIVNTAAASALGRMIMRLGARYHLPVINIVRHQEQVNVLLSLGGKIVLYCGDPTFGFQLHDLMHRLNATVVLDAVGGELSQQVFEAALPGSTFLLYGNLSKQKMTVDPVPLMKNDIRIEGFYLKNWAAKKGILRTLKDIRTVQRLAATDLQTTIRTRLPLSEVQRAIEIYESDRSAGKVLLVPDSQYTINS